MKEWEEIFLMVAFVMSFASTIEFLILVKSNDLPKSLRERESTLNHPPRVFLHFFPKALSRCYLHLLTSEEKGVTRRFVLTFFFYMSRISYASLKMTR